MRPAERIFEIDSRTPKLAGVDPASLGWLDPSRYVATGGSFPIRVSGVGVVAAATASGLSSADDHRLVVDGIREYLRH